MMFVSEREVHGLPLCCLRDPDRYFCHKDFKNIEKGNGPSNLEVKTSMNKEGQSSSDQLNTPRSTGQNIDAAEEHKKAAAGHK